MAKSCRFASISAASLRRRLVQVMACGCGGRQKSRRAELPSKLQPDQRQRSKRTHRVNRLSDLIKADISDWESVSDRDSDTESETKRKIEAYEEMQSAVKRLQSEPSGQRSKAAAEARRLAKDDAEARVTLAMLGAIPPLVGMIDSGDVESQASALYALLNIGIGNDLNKAAIVKAGALHKILNLINSPGIHTSTTISESIVANFLGLSALDSNKPVIGSSAIAVEFLVKSFALPTSTQSRDDALRALFNLSISPPNIPRLVGSDLIPHLLASIADDMSLTDRILAVLSNLVSTSQGRRAVTRDEDGIPSLIDMLNWIDAPTCQEKAAYILMVIAYKSSVDRNLMIQFGVRSALLEVMLVGSPLAQKRAAMTMEILRVDRGKQHDGSGTYGVLGLPAVSAPVSGDRGDEEERGDEGMAISEERRAVKELVSESLQCNMTRIAKRANLPKELGSSKSLPF